MINLLMHDPCDMQTLSGNITRLQEMDCHRQRTEMAPRSVHLLLSLLPCLSILSASSLPDPESFLRCLSSTASPATDWSHLLYLPNSPSYFSLLNSSVQNLRFTSPETPKPFLIIAPTDASQVQASVVCCRDHDLPIRVRSGGHDYEGLSYRSEKKSSFVLVDLADLRSVSVDVEHAVACVEAGATVGELYYRIAEHSKTLGFPAGVCPTVGVGGHLSGGGFGFLWRKYGLAADNVLDAKVVDVNGRILDRESMGEDLFWAIRGGGGASFGVIVSWKVRLVPVPATVSMFTVHRTSEQGAIELMNKWQNIAHLLHDDLLLRVNIAQTEGAKRVEAAFMSMFLGDCEGLLQHMAHRFPELGVERDDCREMTWIESAVYAAGHTNREPLEILMDRGLQPKIFNKGKSDYVTEPLPVTAWEAIWARISEENAGSMRMDPCGGRMSGIAESQTPYPHRKGNLFIIQYLSMWKDGGVAESKQHLDWSRRMYRFMTPYVSKRPRAAYVNFRDLDLGKNEGSGSYSEAKVWGEKYFKNNFRRLAMVKGEVDPGNFFCHEQSIPPLVVETQKMSQ
ncbi:unnamed protein product [Musa textilis]